MQRLWAQQSRGVRVLRRRSRGIRGVAIALLIRRCVLCGLCEKQPDSIHAHCNAAPGTQAMGSK
jgi:hypothetical protein